MKMVMYIITFKSTKLSTLEGPILINAIGLPASEAALANLNADHVVIDEPTTTKPPESFIDSRAL